MTDMIDFAPQARLVAGIAEGVTESQLSGPTPCPEYEVRHLLGHLVGLTGAFRDAGRKDLGPGLDQDPGSAVPELGPGWRTDLPKLLDELVEVWRDPAAWEGMTRAGGLDLPGAVAGAVAMDELVVHGWDLARATGQAYDPDEASLGVAEALLTPEEGDTSGNSLFGPVVPVPDGAPLLDRVIGLSGRDPGWSPGA
ncbi:TIGR03086 family metal-binding protein [Streptomyces durmitorensis]|uniref:TIGR03086 family metal-binding protein n=1 Tax=Streptomyces durmitorensis TaxID=319947 RepID=A0ABY4PZI0_9ACTN|nr:TIGR03086 family metal-binding protein [Streptomyces durmitorensis]UQT59318.1 TIGR03086 family metal-binding protein [Streptomyces durmitorensis]